MSCLFKSLGSSVEMAPNTLRRAIGTFLQTNPKLMDDLSVKDIGKFSEGTRLGNYAQWISQPGTWGGAIEIKAFCELFNMNVVVHVLSNNKTIDFLTSKTPEKKVHISYTGNHFEPMYTELI